MMTAKREMMNKNEILEQFGDVVLSFDSYYKYSFCFQGQGLIVWGGAGPKEIYRAEMKASMTLWEIDFELGGIGWVKKDGVIIYKFYRWD